VKLALIVAVARDGVIGRDNAIPWNLPEDARRFRAVTMGHPVVMGRRTWDSLPERFRPLPGRRNVVVTRNPEWSADGADRAGSLDEALALLEGAPQAFVIGGAELYAEALARADELVVTEIDAEVEGDVYFPPWDRSEFRETFREAHVSEDGVAFAFVTYRRGGQASA
jgi:dihydrofolate reductase